MDFKMIIKPYFIHFVDNGVYEVDSNFLWYVEDLGGCNWCGEVDPFENHKY